MRANTLAQAAVALLATLSTWSCDDTNQRSDPEQCEEYCAPNTGFPCPCDPNEGCWDGSLCGVLDTDHSIGACFAPCQSDSDCVAEMGCNASARCVMTSVADGEKHCGYVCDCDEDCPNNMICVETPEADICYTEL
jgi:hypothetical protein